MHINLKALRVKNGLSQEDLAKKLNMGTATYCNKENGKIDFRMKECEKIMKIFNKTFEEIFIEQ